GPIDTIDAGGLRASMVTTAKSVIVIPSGVFPSTVQNDTGGVVGAWLREGGTLVWMGGPFGYYSYPNARTLDPFTTDLSIATLAQQSILGYRLTETPLEGPLRIAKLSTAFSTALDLGYSDVWVGPTLGLLRSIGGLSVGYSQGTSDSSRSSL